MQNEDDECYYSCIVCGNIMNEENGILSCPVCGNEVPVDEYYDQMDNFRKMFEEQRKRAEEERDDGMLDVDYNEFYKY